LTSEAFTTEEIEISGRFVKYCIRLTYPWDIKFHIAKA